jgi:hypothetical protein
MDSSIDDRLFTMFADIPRFGTGWEIEPRSNYCGNTSPQAVMAPKWAGDNAFGEQRNRRSSPSRSAAHLCGLLKYHDRVLAT